MKGKYLYGIIKKPKDTWPGGRKRAKGLPRERTSSEVARLPAEASAKAGSDSSDGGERNSEVKEPACGRQVSERTPWLSAVDFNSLSAVIAEKEFKDYHLLPKEEVVKELTKHQQTIEKIMENFGTVLPVKFGTILKDEGEVESVVAKGYSFLWDTLRKMEAKIELDLVCFWNEQKAAQLAYQESKKVKNFYKKIVSEVAEKRAKGTPRMVGPTKVGHSSEVKELASETPESITTKITLGKLVAQYLASKKKKLSTQILKVLKKEVMGSCNHALADINMVFNHAFLVEKDNEKRFAKVLDKLNCKFADLVNFRLVGPLPPYSFATVVVETLSKKEIDSAKKILGLDEPFGKEKIKHAYNNLVIWSHPDKGGDPLAFASATKAYKLLTKYVNYQGLVGVYLHKWEEL